MKTILITGINGFLGSHLAKIFLTEYAIIGIEKGINNLARIELIKDKILVYDSETADLTKLFFENDIFCVIHAATYYGRENISYKEIISSNVIFPAKLMELSANNGVELFVNTDSFFNAEKITYTYLSDYALSKKQAVEWMKSFSPEIKSVNLKLQHMYGPYDAPSKFVSQILLGLIENKKEIKLTQGEQKRDFVYIDDVVSAFYTVVKNYNLISSNYIEMDVGSGTSISVKDFVELAHKITKSSANLNFGALSYRQNEIMDSVADLGTWKYFPWQTKVSREEGLIKTIDLLKEGLK